MLGDVASLTDLQLLRVLCNGFELITRSILNCIPGDLFLSCDGSSWYNFVPWGLCLTIFICVHGGPLLKYHVEISLNWTIDSHPGVTTCEWCWGIAKRSHWGQGVSWYVRYFAILARDLDDGQLVIPLTNIDQPRKVNKSLIGFQGCLTTEIRETSSNHSFESFFFISFQFQNSLPSTNIPQNSN